MLCVRIIRSLGTKESINLVIENLGPQISINVARWNQTMSSMQGTNIRYRSPSYSCVDIVRLYNPGNTDILFWIVTLETFKRCILLAQEKHVIICSLRNEHVSK